MGVLTSIVYSIEGEVDKSMAYDSRSRVTTCLYCIPTPSIRTFNNVYMDIIAQMMFNTTNIF